MLYSIAHVVVSLFARLFFRLKVIGAENVPESGAVIVAANHNSYFDIPLLGCALPRRVDNMAKSELFKNKLIAKVFSALGGFPVRRSSVDRKAIKEAVSRLKKGHCLSLYPEGTRSPDGQLQKARPGIGFMAVASGAKIVPVFMKGTHRPRIFRPITIQFGEVIDFSREMNLVAKEEMHHKKLYDTIASTTMARIAALQSKLV